MVPHDSLQAIKLYLEAVAGKSTMFGNTVTNMLTINSISYVTQKAV